MRRHAAAAHQPQLPVIAKALQLAMAADAKSPTGAQDARGIVGELREDVFLVAEPAAGRAATGHAGHAATRLLRQFLIGRETLELGIGVWILACVEIVLAPRPAVVHQQRRRVRAVRPRHERRHVATQRRDAHRMLQAGVAVDGFSEVQLHVERPFGGRHELLLARRLDDPLARLSHAGDVHLDRLGVVVTAVAREHVARMLLVADLVLVEDARAGGVDARSHDLSRLDQILVREHVGRRGLRITRGRDAVREVREVGPRLRLVDGVPLGAQVRVRVHEAGHDGGAGHVHRCRASRHGDRTGRTNCGDAVVTHDDVAARNDLVALHGDDARVAQHDRATRNVARGLQEDATLDGCVRLRSSRVSRLRRVATQCGNHLITCARRIQVVDDVCVADGPVHPPPICRPGRELAADVGELAHRHDGGVRIRNADGRLHAARRHDDGVEVLVHLRERHVAVR